MFRCQRKCHRFESDIPLQRYGETMEQNSEVNQPSAFKQEWEQKKLLKRAKKKAKHQLEKQGFGRKEASKQVNNAVNRIASNKPTKRAAGRGG